MIKMVHPKPSTPQQEAVYGYLLGRPHEVTLYLVQTIAARLRDPEAIRHAKAFPYQLLAAYTTAEDMLPHGDLRGITGRDGNCDRQCPRLCRGVYVCLDVSGSMATPVTGYRHGATSAVRCVDVAALVTAAVLRGNPSAVVLPFERMALEISVNPRDSVMTNAEKLASLPAAARIAAHRWPS